MIVHICDPSAQEPGAGEAQAQDHLTLARTHLENNGEMGRPEYVTCVHA